jgi:DNA (cytosine-5)-methyltransferase 1
MLGLHDVGLEWDAAACRTRVAAGHLTIQCDVAQYPTAPLIAKTRGGIWSPPCTLFSSAGKGTGRLVLDVLGDGIVRLFRGDDCRAAIRDRIFTVALVEQEKANAKRKPEKRWSAEKVSAAARSDAYCAALVLEPARFIADMLRGGGPLEWVALEQVPAVLPLWKVYAHCLRGLGWSVWVGILNAADYGVPQTRERAIVAASRVRTVTAPDPTHAKVAEPDGLFGPGRDRWVSMAEALRLGGGHLVNTRGERTTPGGNEFSADGPSWALTEKTRSWALKHSDRANATVRDADEPAATLAFGHARNEYEWVLRNGTQDNAAVRPLDEPAGTLFFGARCNDVSWVLRTGNNTMKHGRTGSKAGEGGVVAYERPVTEPAPTLDTGAGGKWTLHRPATTVCATNRIAPPGHRDRSPKGESQFASPETVRISIPEASILQSFPVDYPWQGTRTKQFEQIGNAVPPLLAAHVLSAATGIPMPAVHQAAA